MRCEEQMVVGRKAFELAFFTKTGIYRCVRRASDATRRLQARLSRERIRRRTLSLFNLNRPCIRNPSYAPPVTTLLVLCAASSFSSSHLPVCQRKNITLDIGSDFLFKLTMESTSFKMREEYFDTLFESLELSGKVYGLGPLSERLRDSIG